MFRVRLKEPEVSYDTGRPIARLEITGGNYREWYSAQQGDKEYSVKITPYRLTELLLLTVGGTRFLWLSG